MESKTELSTASILTYIGKEFQWIFAMWEYHEKDNLGFII